MANEYTLDPVDFNRIPMSSALLQQQQNENALFPLRQQQYQQATDLGALNLQQAKTGDYNQRILQAAEQVDDEDPDEAARQWDENFTKLDKAGVPGAKQWIGRYSLDRKSTIRSMYAPAALPAQRGSAGALPGGGGVPSALSPLSPSQNYDLNNQSPQQIQQHLQKSNQIVGELDRVFQSHTPAQEWARIQMQDPEAAKLGPYDPQRLRQIRDEQKQFQQVYQERYGQQMAGVPPERNIPQIDKTGTGAYAVDPYAQGGPTAKELYREPKSDDWLTIGYDDAGHPISQNRSTGETKTDKSVTIKQGRYTARSASGRLGNTQAERFADRFMEIHKNDPQYVNDPGKLEEDAINWGRGFSKPPKDMSDAEIALAAARASFGDPAMEKQLIQEITAARASDRARTAAPSRSAPPPAPAPGQRIPGTIYSTPKGPLTWTGTGWRQ